MDREVTVLVELRPGAFPDLTKPDGVKVFAPRHMAITYISRDSAALRRWGWPHLPEWSWTAVRILGSVRLKSGGTSDRLELDASYHSARELPPWAHEVVEANLPRDVDPDDLPVQPAAGHCN